MQETGRRAGTEWYRERVDRTQQRGGVGRAQLARGHESGSGRITLLTARLALFTRSSTDVSRPRALAVASRFWRIALAWTSPCSAVLVRSSTGPRTMRSSSRTGDLAHDVERDVGERRCVPHHLTEHRGLAVGDLQHVRDLALSLVRDTHRVAHESGHGRVLGRLDERAHLAQRVAHDLLLVGIRAAAHLGAHELLELRRE